MSVSSKTAIRRCSLKELFLNILQYSKEEDATPMLESLFNKIAGLKACNFTKKRLQHRSFLVNIAKFSRTAFIEHLWWLLLVSL